MSYHRDRECRKLAGVTTVGFAALLLVFVVVVLPDVYESFECTPVHVYYRETVQPKHAGCDGPGQLHECTSCNASWPAACCSDTPLSTPTSSTCLWMAVTWMQVNDTNTLQTLDIDCGTDLQCQDTYRLAFQGTDVQVPCHTGLSTKGLKFGRSPGVWTDPGVIVVLVVVCLLGLLWIGSVGTACVFTRRVSRDRLATVVV